MPTSDEIALVDLSGIVHAEYAKSGSEPDPDHASQQALVKVRQMTVNHLHAAICCDHGRSFRKDLVPTYKATRPQHDAALIHQLRRTEEQLKKEGYAVWGVDGYEADDIIAAATMRAVSLDSEMRVLIFSGDKDLLQLVGPRVRVMNTKSGNMLDEAAVIAKFGVMPEQMTDFWSLVGDTSDNIKGAHLIGLKGAATLLNIFGSIDRLYKALDDPNDPRPAELKPKMRESLDDFRARVEQVRSLVALRYDAPIPFEEIAAERQAPDVQADVPPMRPAEAQSITDESAVVPEKGEAALFTTMRPSTVEAFEQTGTPVINVPQLQVPDSTQIVFRQPEVLALVPYEKALDPRNWLEARDLAKDMFASHMFAAYGNPPAVLSTILMGREMGLSAMTSLRMFHNIEGKHSPSAALLTALVLKSGFAEFFEPIDMSETSVTYETKRKGARKPVTLTYTIEDAKRAGASFKAGSGWVKDPTAMLIARCQSRLARLVYPDICGGLYTPDELAEIKEARVA